MSGLRISMCKSGLKSSFGAISIVVDSIDQWDPNTATPMEKVCGL